MPKFLIPFILLIPALCMYACSAPQTPNSITPVTPARVPTGAPSLTPLGVFPTGATLPTFVPTVAAATAAAAPFPATATPTIVADTPTATISPTPLPFMTVQGCGTIDTPGYYKLLNDIKSPAGHDCFTISSHNVVFDCDNHTIEGSTAGIKLHQYAYYAFFIRKFGFLNAEKATNVEIKNCIVLHHRTAIFVGGANNVYIHDNNFSNNYDDVDQNRFGIFLGPPPDGSGLRLDTVQGGRVENNTMNNEAIGIDIRDSDSITVHNNTTSRNSAWGISVLNTSHSEVSANIVRDNIRYCQWGNGTIGRGCDAGGIILHDGASHNVVKDNLIAGENGNGVFIKAHGSRCGDDNLIENNKITDAVYNGIEMGFCDNNRVIGNEISGSLDAVFFDFSSNTEISGNTIRNMNNHGIISVNSRNSLVADNQIINAREGIYFYWETYDPQTYFFLTPSPDQYASRDNTIANNLLSDNSVAAIHLANSIRNRVTHNTFANNTKNVWVEGRNDGNVIAELTTCDMNCPPLLARK